MDIPNAKLLEILDVAHRSHQPALYFAGGGLDERQMFYYHLDCPYSVQYVDGQVRDRLGRREYFVVETVEQGGHCYTARQMDRHLLFRRLESPPAEDSLYLADTDFTEFREAYSLRTPGRCLMHVPRCMEQSPDTSLFFGSVPSCKEVGHCIYLFFNCNGTGFGLHLDARQDKYKRHWVIKYERVDFWWNDVQSVSDILSVPVGELRELCETLFEERINPYLRAPYTYPENREEIPLAWVSGSEQELRSLVRAICLTEPGLCDAQQPITAVFRATTQAKRGGLLRLEREKQYNKEYITSSRLVSLCELAFRLNPFRGMHWIDRPSMRGSVQKVARQIRITVEPPSAHEKAEAYLTLFDWLNGTLYNSEKRARFSLPPRSVVEE